MLSTVEERRGELGDPTDRRHPQAVTQATSIPKPRRPVGQEGGSPWGLCRGDISLSLPLWRKRRVTQRDGAGGEERKQREAKAGRGGSTGQGRLLVYPAPRSVQIRLPRESQGDAEAKSLLCPSRCRRWDCGSQNRQEAGLGVLKGHT